MGGCRNRRGNPGADGVTSGCMGMGTKGRWEPWDLPPWWDPTRSAHPLRRTLRHPWMSAGPRATPRGAIQEGKIPLAEPGLAPSPGLYQPHSPVPQFPLSEKKRGLTVGQEDRAVLCHDSDFHFTARSPWGDFALDLGVQSARQAQEAVAVGELGTDGMGYK